MGVLEAHRSLSTMEFYKNAEYMRRDITRWMLRDFGSRRHCKNVARIAKDVSDEDRAAVDAILGKYGSTSNEFVHAYPEWWLDYERRYVSDAMHDMMTCITEANSIYPYRRKGKDGTPLAHDPVYEAECALRRTLQDRAIAACHHLYQELQYIQGLFPQDLRGLAPLLDKAGREISLLKGWRQGDNRRFAAGE